MEIGGTMSRCMEAWWELVEAPTGHDRGMFYFASNLLPLKKIPLPCASFRSGNFHGSAWTFPSTSNPLPTTSICLPKVPFDFPSTSI